MYERLKALYAAGKITQQQLGVAVAKGWISAEQASEIAS